MREKIPILKCDNCDEEVDLCNECGKGFAVGQKIICLYDGELHYYSCENYSGENNAFIIKSSLSINVNDILIIKMYNRLYKNRLFCIADYTNHKKKIVHCNT